MFEDNDVDDSDDEFEGFESDWKTGRITTVIDGVFSTTRQDLPADATPLQAFSHIFTDEL